MTLKGKDAEEFLQQIERRNAEVKRQELANAKDDAVARGKEQFDLAKLEALCDTSSEGRLAPIDERRKWFEYLYYVSNPQVMTVSEFATIIEKMNKW